MKIHIAALIWVTHVSFVSAQPEKSLQNLFELGLLGDRESVISFIQELRSRSRDFQTTGKVDTKYLDMLYSLRNIPDEGVTISYDEELWSRQVLVVSELAKLTNYAKTLAKPLPNEDGTPPIDTFAIQMMKEEGRDKFLVWYRDTFRDGSVITDFKVPVDNQKKKENKAEMATPRKPSD